MGGKICALLCDVLLIMYAATAEYNPMKLRSALFTRVTQTNYSILVVSRPWMNDTNISCILTCLSKYPSCQSVTYNPISRLCTRVWQIADNSRSRSRLGDNDILYTSPYCKPGLGFNFISFKSVLQCYFISKDSSDFRTARATCAARGSILYTAKTNDALDLLFYISQNITQSSTWLGLTDIIKENNFVWEDNEVLTSPKRWDRKQPDNGHSGENCCETTDAGQGTVDQFINDALCSKLNPFVCEST